MNVVPIAVAFLMVGAGGTTIYMANEMGYIPVKPLLQTKKPVGYTEVCSECIKKQLPALKSTINDIPNINNIEYKVYISSSNHIEIAEDYKDKLIAEGYHEKTSGIKEIHNITLYYYGYLKGITAVGIIITSGESLGYPEAESFVLYSTGNIADYKEIIEWLNENGLDGKNIKIPI